MSLVRLKSRQHGVLYLLSVCLLAFLGLCALNICRVSLWLDEAFSANLVRYDFGQIANYTSIDVHPPMYYWVLKCWASIFGTTELAFRSISTLFGAISLVLIFFLVKKAVNSNAALFAVSTVSLSPFFIRYSTEARMYTMESAILLASSLVLLYVNSRPKLWILFAVLASLAMWTHYFAALVILAQVVWFAKTKYDRNIITWLKGMRNMLFAGIGAIILYIPWIQSVVKLAINTRKNGFWISKFEFADLLQFFTDPIFYDNNYAQIINRVTPVLFILIVTFLLFALKNSFYDKMLKKNDSFLLIVSLFYIPVISLSLLSCFEPLFIDRYLLPSVIFVLVLIGIVVANQKQKLKLTLIATLAISFVIGNISLYTNGKQEVNLHQSMNRIAAESVSNEKIIVEDQLEYLTVSANANNIKNHEVYILRGNIKDDWGSLQMEKDAVSNHIDYQDLLPGEHYWFFKTGLTELEYLENN